MCMRRSLARGRENMKCVLERKKSKKTDEGSSVLLYFVTEEGERE